MEFWILNVFLPHSAVIFDLLRSELSKVLGIVRCAMAHLVHSNIFTTSEFLWHGEFLNDPRYLAKLSITLEISSVLNVLLKFAYQKGRIWLKCCTDHKLANEIWINSFKMYPRVDLIILRILKTGCFVSIILTNLVWQLTSRGCFVFISWCLKKNYHRIECQHRLSVCRRFNCENTGRKH